MRLGWATLLLPGCAIEMGFRDLAFGSGEYDDLPCEGLCIDEFMTLNKRFCEVDPTDPEADPDHPDYDDDASFPDWLDLYNAGPDPVELGGLLLGAGVSKLNMWTLPDAVIEPGGCRLVLADRDIEQGPWHATFSLNREFGQIFLIEPASAGQDAEVIDRIWFDYQGRGWTERRDHDTDGMWTYQPVGEPCPHGLEQPIICQEGV